MWRIVCYMPSFWKNLSLPAGYNKPYRKHCHLSENTASPYRYSVSDIHEFPHHKIMYVDEAWGSHSNNSVGYDAVQCLTMLSIFRTNVLPSRGSNRGGDEIFRTRSDQPWGPVSLLYSGYRVSLPRVKRPGRGVNHPSTLAPRLKKE